MYHVSILECTIMNFQGLFAMQGSFANSSKTERGSVSLG